MAFLMKIPPLVTAAAVSAAALYALNLLTKTSQPVPPPTPGGAIDPITSGLKKIYCTINPSDPACANMKDEEYERRRGRPHYDGVACDCGGTCGACQMDKTSQLKKKIKQLKQANQKSLNQLNSALNSALNQSAAAMTVPPTAYGAYPGWTAPYSAAPTYGYAPPYNTPQAPTPVGLSEEEAEALAAGELTGSF